MENNTTQNPVMNISIADMKNNTSDIGDYFTIDWDIFRIFQKVFCGGLIPLVVLIGIVGNTLSLIVLSRQKNKNSTTIILLSLMIADLCFLIALVVALYLQIAVLFAPDYAFSIFFKFITPFNVFVLPVLGRIGHVLLVVMSIERAIAVTFPIKVKQMCTKRTMIILIVSVYLFVALLNIPNLFLYEVKTVTLPDGNMTTYVALGSFGKHVKAFEIYYICSEVILCFIPMSAVIICNCIISFTLITSATWRKRNTDSCAQNNNDEIQITKTLLGITFTYVICLLPAVISRLIILNDPSSTFYQQTNGIHRILGLAGFFTESVNSSVNFIIYIAFSKTYRKEFLSICHTSARRHVTISRYIERTQVYQLSDSSSRE